MAAAIEGIRPPGFEPTLDAAPLGRQGREPTDWRVEPPRGSSERRPARSKREFLYTLHALYKQSLLTASTSSMRVAPVSFTSNTLVQYLPVTHIRSPSHATPLIGWSNVA